MEDEVERFAIDRVKSVSKRAARRYGGTVDPDDIAGAIWERIAPLNGTDKWNKCYLSVAIDKCSKNHHQRTVQPIALVEDVQLPESDYSDLYALIDTITSDISREAIRMYASGSSRDAIAEKLGISKSSVRDRISSATNRLRKALDSMTQNDVDGLYGN